MRTARTAGPVGRQAEIARIDGLLAEAAAGTSGVVALAGAAGIGKSVLARHCVARAVRQGFVELHGAACAYQGDLSFAPVVEALRPLVRGGDRGLLDGLSDLGRLFDGLPLPPPVVLGDPGLERARLFDTIAELVQRAAARAPVALLVEDVHWADPSSLDVLQYLGRAVARSRCLLVLTYRPDEAGPEVRRMLASLRRGGWLSEVDVPALGPADVAALAASLLDDDPPQALLDLLAERAAGVPLVVVELVTALRSSGALVRSGGRWVLTGVAATPATVVELFEERMADLSPDDRAVLGAVGACGDEASIELLAAMRPGPDLPERLDRLCARGLLLEHHTDGLLGYRASHPLLAQAAYDALSTHVRQSLHAAAVDAVTDDPSRSAHHIARAGAAVEPKRALDVLVVATAHAVQRRAGEEGVLHARAGLGIARRLGRDDLVPVLLDGLAGAAAYAGMIDARIAALAELVGLRADPAERARSLLRLALAEIESGRLDAATAHLDDAVAALDSCVEPDVETRVSIAQARLVLHTRAGPRTAVLAAVEELERIGRERATALAAYGRLELSRYMSGPVDELAVDAAIDAVAATSDPAVVAYLERISMGTALGRGEHRVVARRAEHSLALTRAAGVPELAVVPTAFAGFGLFAAGSWDSALALSDRTLELAHRVGLDRGIALALVLRALVVVQRGEATEAQSCIADARAIRADRRLARLVAAAAARVALVAGDPARALALAPSDGPFALPVLCLQVRAEACLAGGDSHGFQQAVDDLDSLGFPYATAAADRLKGLAAGNSELLERAVAVLDGLELPFDAAVCRLDLAEARAAADPARACLAVFDDLGAGPAGDRARRLLRSLGVRTRPRDRSAGELSSRETEVALLVAEGLSNAAVAQRLFLSPRTVTTHLDNMYRRLGLSSRAELSRYVDEHVRPTTYPAPQAT